MIDLKRAWVAVAWLSMAGCTQEGDATNLTEGTGDVGVVMCEPTYASLRDDIFAAKCTKDGCHAATMSAASLDLTTADPAALINAPSICDGEIRVVPGDPSSSTLYTKLTDSPPCGKRMPLGGDPLSATEMDCIAGWITDVQGSCETCGGSVCIDLQNDPANCGACGVACPAGISCDAGQCACPGGGEVCDGACVTTSSDPANCGSCGNACTGTEVCFTGQCGNDCGTLTQCGQSCIDTTTDPANCGGCGNACASGQACVGGTCACDGPTVSFAADIEPLLAGSCATMGCHRFPAPKEGLDLSFGKVYTSLVGVPSGQCNGRTLVDPGSVSTSYLVNKLRGVDMCFGTRMPKGASSLPSTEIAKVESWICNGAAND